MNVLVTGVTGFTGSRLARYLVDAGHKVRGLVRRASLERARPLEAIGLKTVAGDLTELDTLGPACHEVDVVYHIAASYRTAGQSDATYRAINVGGTENLLCAAEASGVRRFVHCSTGGVHGNIDKAPATESAPLKPGDIYQVTKLEAERFARAIGERSDIEVVVARPIGIYGPGDVRFLKLFRGIARRRFPILGSGQIFYHLTYIDDLVEGFRLCGEMAAAVGRTYLLAGPAYTTLEELTELIAVEFGVEPPRLRLPVWPFWLGGALCEAICVPFGLEPPIYRRRVEFFTKSRAFDTTRARQELGFNPMIDLRTGIHRTAVWYREQGWL